MKVSFSTEAATKVSQFEALTAQPHQEKSKIGYEMMRFDEMKLDPKEEFQKLFSFVPEMKDTIVTSMNAIEYDMSQPIIYIKILTEPESDWFIADGHHRRESGLAAGLEEGAIFRKIFDTREAARLYVLHLQLDRRNLTPGEKIGYLQELDRLKSRGRKKADEETDIGASATATAAALGVSPRSVDRMRAITKTGNEELINAVKTNQLSVTAGAEKAAELQGKKKRTNIKKVNTEVDIDPISDAIGSNEGCPKGLNFNHSDGVERPHVAPWETDDFKNKLVERYKEGFVSGFEKGVSEGAYQVYEKILELVRNQKSANEIENDECFADFSFVKISELFKIPSVPELILNQFNKASKGSSL